MINESDFCGCKYKVLCVSVNSPLGPGNNEMGDGVVKRVDRCDHGLSLM